MSKPIAVNKSARLKVKYKNWNAGTIVHVVQEFPLEEPLVTKCEVRFPDSEQDYIDKKKLEFNK